MTGGQLLTDAIELARRWRTDKAGHDKGFVLIDVGHVNSTRELPGARDSQLGALAVG